MNKSMGVVEIYEDFFTGTQAEDIIKAAEAIDKANVDFGFEDATIGKGHKGGEVRSNLLMSLSAIAQYPNEGRSFREAIKNGTDNHIQDIKNICDLIQRRLQDYVNDYTKRYEFPILFDEGYQLLKYRGGQQYKGHSDYAPHIPRYLSALILLNPQEYEGGGTYFHHFDEMVKPEKPSLVLFPSNYAYAHQAMPVISGTKYAIVTWLGHPMEIEDMPPMYKQGAPRQ